MQTPSEEGCSGGKDSARGEVAWVIRQCTRPKRETSYILAEDSRRDGRVAEGGGLLNRCRVKSSTGGSNPPLSASESFSFIISNLCRIFGRIFGAKSLILRHSENRERGSQASDLSLFLCWRESRSGFELRMDREFDVSLGGIQSFANPPQKSSIEGPMTLSPDAWCLLCEAPSFTCHLLQGAVK